MDQGVDNGDVDQLATMRRRIAALEAELHDHRRERAMVHALLETMPAVVLRISLDGTIEFINRVLPAYASRPPTGHSVYSYAPPDQHDLMRAALEKTQRTGEVSSFESVALAPDGTRDWYWSVVGPVFEDRALVGLTLICTNITRAKRAEQELRDSHEHLALALDAGNVGVWRWDATTDEVVWDAKLCQMFGVAPAAAPRTRAAFLALVSDDQRPALRAHIDAALASGVYMDFDLRADLPGEVRWFIIKGGVVRDDDGAIVGLMGGVVDDTERHRLEVQVADAQKLDALGQLSAGVAHNFNNMLAAIVPAIELAAREVRPPVAEILGGARDAALRAADLVKQLMQFSRRDHAARPRLEPLERVLARALLLCRNTFGREITLTERGIELAAAVTVDGPQMEQALLNLFINARDALQGVDSPRAQIEVAVERRPGVAGAPAALQVQVRDTGAGMDNATRARVFEPFFTTKAIGHGTGLGLATVWASVRAHRGSISCDSVPGGGTTFTILLPLDDSAAAAAPEGMPVDATPGNGELVLIIDDEPALRQIISALLIRAGYRVATAASGAEGVQLFRAQPADLVLLDHSMPGQSPATTLAQLRALAPGLPIVSFSGLGATLVDATAHLHKPVDSNTLLATIRAVLPPPR